MGDSFTKRVTGLFHFLDNLDLIYEKQYKKPVKEIARRDKRKKRREIYSNTFEGRLTNDCGTGMSFRPITGYTYQHFFRISTCHCYIYVLLLITHKVGTNYFLVKI